MADAILKTLTNIDKTQVYYPYTTTDAVYGLDSKIVEEVDVQLNDKLSGIMSAAISTQVVNISWPADSTEVTVTVNGVTTDSILFISPIPASYTIWGENKIRAVSQSVNSITFVCDTIPSGQIGVNIVIWEV